MRRRVKITKRMVDGVVLPASGEVNLWDSEVPGFSLRVRSTGSRVYVVEYRNRAQRKRRVTLGPHGRLTVDQARDLARQILAAVARGEDPAEDRQESLSAPTIDDLASRYLEQHAAPKKKASSTSADARALRLYVFPFLGRRKVAEVGVKDIAELHNAMLDKPIQANRTLALLSKMFSLAERWGLRSPGLNPCHGIDRFPENRRERFLSGAEIARLGAVLVEEELHEPFVVLAIRLLLLTGARRDEVLTLRWSDVDFERSALRLPDSKTGAKVIPLGPAALSLLALAPRLEENPYVIPGRRVGGRLVGIHRPWVRIRDRAGLENVRLHDLRHSFASIGAAAGLGLPILGAILGHRSHATTARYAHLDDDPRRVGAARISDEIAAALSGRAVEERETPTSLPPRQ
ncbi:MAG TPA: site-specific integrase [Thermoanaerobaculia bacterium]|nr:site-specific integrase [Thermoanaerobaculia bacterium]